MVKPLSAANSASLTRREFTLGIGVSALMAATPRSANAVGGPDLLLILIADLHSGYAYTAALVKAVRDLARSGGLRTPWRVRRPGRSEPGLRRLPGAARMS